MSTACAQCGAVFADPSQSCEEQFNKLLALDHSRLQPWGSRHGLAFSTFALQHPAGRTTPQLEACWVMLYRVWMKGDNRAKLAAAMRAQQNLTPMEWGVPPLPRVPAAGVKYAVTIADLGEFDADTYVKKLEDWGKATLAAWGR
ncbi:MAG TPA: DUF5946 family protein [Gemmatimonadaceae bacterium]|nr:DUF5946 family protein [Gemmatimonadaceae bacterium]